MYFYISTHLSILRRNDNELCFFTILQSHFKFHEIYLKAILHLKTKTKNM